MHNFFWFVHFFLKAFQRFIHCTHACVGKRPWFSEASLNLFPIDHSTEMLVFGEDSLAVIIRGLLQIQSLKPHHSDPFELKPTCVCF